jgi:hypothetical protein
MDQKDVGKEKILRLDPGPRRRIAPSSYSFCLWGVLGVIAIAAGFVVMALYMVASTMVLGLREPHRALYHNASAPDAPAIRPLLHANTTFDIAATVWVRAPRAEERYFNLRQSGGGKDAEKAYNDVLPSNVPYLLEYTVFSGVVFRGLRMHDRHVSAEVNFTFPTARLCVRSLSLEWRCADSASQPGPELH